MPRETRAATGNSRPRIFSELNVVVPPVKKRAITNKTKANSAAKRAPKKGAAGSKPTGVIKTKSAAKKKTSAGTGDKAKKPAARKENTKPAVEEEAHKDDNKAEGALETAKEKAVGAVTGDKAKKPGAKKDAAASKKKATVNTTAGAANGNAAATPVSAEK